MRILLLLLIVSALPVSAGEIEVQALFGGAAVLVINGQRQMIRTGEEKFGIRLISADTSQAIIEYNGKRQTVTLSDRISSNYSEPGETKVMIQMNEHRQYFTQGSINGRSVRFLVDTGANVISLGADIAAHLGVSLENGREGLAQTAGGKTRVTSVVLKEVQVGAIKQRNVRAVVSHAQHPEYVLLGMTFLQHVDIRENAGLMVLTSKL